MTPSFLLFLIIIFYFPLSPPGTGMAIASCILYNLETHTITMIQTIQSRRSNSRDGAPVRVQSVSPIQESRCAEIDACLSYLLVRIAYGMALLTGVGARKEPRSVSVWKSCL